MTRGRLKILFIAFVHYSLVNNSGKDFCDRIAKGSEGKWPKEKIRYLNRNKKIKNNMHPFVISLLPSPRIEASIMKMAFMLF